MRAAALPSFDHAGISPHRTVTNDLAQLSSKRMVIIGCVGATLNLALRLGIFSYLKIARIASGAVVIEKRPHINKQYLGKRFVRSRSLPVVDASSEDYPDLRHYTGREICQAET